MKLTLTPQHGPIGANQQSYHVNDLTLLFMNNNVYLQTPYERCRLNNNDVVHINQVSYHVDCRIDSLPLQSSIQPPKSKSKITSDDPLNFLFKDKDEGFMTWDTFIDASSSHERILKQLDSKTGLITLFDSKSTK